MEIEFEIPQNIPNEDMKETVKIEPKTDKIEEEIMDKNKPIDIPI